MVRGCRKDIAAASERPAFEHRNAHRPASALSPAAASPAAAAPAATSRAVSPAPGPAAADAPSQASWFAGPSCMGGSRSRASSHSTAPNAHPNGQSSRPRSRLMAWLTSRSASAFLPPPLFVSTPDRDAHPDEPYQPRSPLTPLGRSASNLQQLGGCRESLSKTWCGVAYGRCMERLLAAGWLRQEVSLGLLLCFSFIIGGINAVCAYLIPYGWSVVLGIAFMAAAVFIGMALARRRVRALERLPLFVAPCLFLTFVNYISLAEVREAVVSVGW